MSIRLISVKRHFLQGPEVFQIYCTTAKPVEV